MLRCGIEALTSSTQTGGAAPAEMWPKSHRSILFSPETGGAIDCQPEIGFGLRGQHVASCASNGDIGKAGGDVIAINRVLAFAALFSIGASVTSALLCA
jgi:hypothetical protein